MSKAVLISIRPKWCELIASGEKTIEVRKTAPKIETPFKCYIYETQGKTDTPWMDEDGHMVFRGRGAVIGEFVCDRIIEWHYIPDPDESADPGSMAYDVLTVDGEKTGLEYDEFADYGKGAPLYGWHISDLVIYDEPMELSDFMKPCNPDPDGIPLCLQCKRLVENYGCGGTILRPPQSWGYVEELT